LDKPNIPVFRRRKLEHTIIDNSTKGSSGSYDDTVSFNTQSGSQWDGLRHVVHREVGALYNGVTKDEIDGPQRTGLLGIDSKAPP
jgi:hypothetical protein